MRTLLAALLCVLIVLAPGCGVLSPEEKASVRQTATEEYQAGRMKKADYDALMAALDHDGDFDWEGLAWTGVAIAGSLLGVRIQRGVPTQRAGLSASKVKPT